MPTKAVSVGTTAVVLVEESRNRTAILLANPDTAAILYISDEADKCTTGLGIPLYPETYIMLSIYEGINTEAKWWVISDTAGKSCRVGEFYAPPPQQIVPPSNAKRDPPITWSFGVDAYAKR